ncbi:MAG TPA: NAD-dependent epimerase/dehydratase family protein [Cytophagaceae bacterium]|nr:NAD-dependent epimerase/dehydratase family protein [Cytophagaceae bacterium]
MVFPTKILVTGAAGFLGGRLVKHLIQVFPQASIIGTSRKSDRKAEFEILGIQFIAGDLSDKEFCQNITQQTDLIIHCAALSSPWGALQEFENANIVSTQNLLEASIDNKVKRFIFISTPSIYFEYKDRFNVKESDPLPRHMVNHYAATKLEAEKIVLAANGNKIETLALRPRAIIGAEDTVIFPRLIKAYKEGKLKIIGTGKNIADLTCVRNVIEAVLCSIRAGDQALGQAYNITNGDPVLLWEKINLLLQVLQLAPLKKKIPAALVMTVATLMEWKAKLFHPDKEPTLTRYGIGVLAYSLTMDISKANAQLGYHPVQTTEEGLEEFIAWYQTSN